MPTLPGRAEVLTWPAAWLNWATSVLQGIGAPVSDTNLQTLWDWTAAEKPKPAGSNVLQWNNPLNTTEKALGSSNSGAQPGPHDVQVYPDIQTGVNATIRTLENGFYPNILKDLRSSLPHSSWQNAVADLGKWGTGAGWLGTSFGSSATGQNVSESAASNPNASPDAGIFGIPGAIAAFGDTLTKDLARAGFLLGGLLIFILGLALVVVPEFLKKAPLPVPVKAPLKVLEGGEAA